LIMERVQLKGEARRAALSSQQGAGDALTTIAARDGNALPIEEDTPIADAGGGPAWVWFVGGMLLGGVLIVLWLLYENRFQRRGTIRVDK